MYISLQNNIFFDISMLNLIFLNLRKNQLKKYKIFIITIII